MEAEDKTIPKWKQKTSQSFLTWLISLLAMGISVGSMIYQQAVINTRIVNHVENAAIHETDEVKRARVKAVILAAIGEGIIPPKNELVSDIDEIKQMLRDYRSEQRESLLAIEERLRNLEIKP